MPSPEWNTGVTREKTTKEKTKRGKSARWKKLFESSKLKRKTSRALEWVPHQAHARKRTMEGKRWYTRDSKIFFSHVKLEEGTGERHLRHT